MTLKNWVYLMLVTSSAVLAQLPLKTSDENDCHVDCREERSRPVCGSDGRTYTSRCEIEKARCEGHPVEFMHRGKCPETARCRAERALAQAQARSVRGMVYIPECREDGTFSEVQCQKSIGYCWCVDQFGKPVPGSSLRYKKPKCSRQGCSNVDRSTFNHNLIEIFKSEFNRLPQTSSAPESGIDTLVDTEEKRVIQWKFDELDSNKDNSLKRKEVRDLRRMTKRIVKPRQCAKSFTKYCDLDQDNKISRSEWSVCLGVDINISFRLFMSLNSEEQVDQLDQDELNVDEVVKESMGDNKDVYVSGLVQTCERDILLPEETPSIWDRPGMRLKHDDGGSDTVTDSSEEADRLASTELQDCLTARAAAMESHRQDPEGGIYIPECTDDGSYEQSQCHKSTSVCWCVNPKTGKPIRGTAARGSRPDCANVLRSARTFKGCSIQRQQLFLVELIDSINEQMQTTTRNSSQSSVPTVAKDETARWKFSELDINNNQSLDKKEWIMFRKEWKEFLKNNKRRRKVRKLRKCWRNFPRYCDENNNSKITLEEWLQCTRTVREARGQLPLNQKRRGPNPFSTILKSD